MKRLVFTLLSVVATSTVMALPVGNPNDASLLYEGVWLKWADPADACGSWLNMVNFRFGFYGDYVFQRNMRFESHKDFERVRLFTNAGYLVVNFNQRVDLFGTVGASSLDARTDAIVVGGGTPGSIVNALFKTTVSWSAGGRITLLELGDTAIGLEAQYFQFKPKLDVVIIPAMAMYQESPTKYWERQVGLGISHRINRFVPYVAVKWASSVIKVIPANSMMHPYLRSNKHWGCALGVTMISCERASVTAEARYGDERAFHVNGQIRF